jgi:DNA (cytosine-5)-methyltransferase 1
MVFNEVQAELEAQGYEVLPFLLPACAVNAPHRRDRIWFVAHSKSNGWDGRECKQREGIEINQWEFCEHKTKGWDEIWAESQRYSKEGDVAKPNGNGLNECNGNNEINPGERRLNALGDINESNGNGNVADTKSNGSTICKLGKSETEQQIQTRSNIDGFKGLGNVANTKNQGLEGLRREEGGYSELYRGQHWIQYWQNFPTVSPICVRDDGLSDRLDNITFPKWRNESIKAAGNAIVPQVVYQIFKAIEEYERITTANTN